MGPSGYGTHVCRRVLLTSVWPQKNESYGDVPAFRVPAIDEGPRAVGRVGAGGPTHSVNRENSASISSASLR